MAAFKCGVADAVMVGIFAILYGMVAFCLWFIGLGSHTGMNIDGTDEVRRIHVTLLAGAAALYAIYRLARFHPACNPAYAAWLKLSPWTADKPLPLGPIHLVWQDTVVLGVLTTIAVWCAHLAPISLLLVFGGVYLGGLTLLLALTRRWRSCVILGFLWPALLLPEVERVTATVIVAAIVGVIWHGVRTSLRAFPWEFLKASRPARSILQADVRIEIATTYKTPVNVGWPLVALSPKIQCYSVPTIVSACLSTLAGWWCFCLISYLQETPPAEVIFLFTVVAAIIRLVIYCGGVTPPFNLWGRMVSGRILIPGFDKVFLTPLALLLVAIVGAMAIRRAGVWSPAVESGVLAALLFVLFSGGPTLRSWLLTGQHRFRPPPRLAANQQRLRSI